jgi:hypothetical protein
LSSCKRDVYGARVLDNVAVLENFVLCSTSLRCRCVYRISKHRRTPDSTIFLDRFVGGEEGFAGRQGGSETFLIFLLEGPFWADGGRGEKNFLFNFLFNRKNSLEEIFCEKKNFFFLTMSSSRYKTRRSLLLPYKQDPALGGRTGRGESLNFFA